MALERISNNSSLINNIDKHEVQITLDKISAFQNKIKNIFKQGIDYGIIPGYGDKPTLLKPGAEKILMLLGLTSEYEIIEKVQDYENNFFAFTIKCSLYKQGIKVTEGLGHCNSRESKFVHKWVTENQIPENLDKENLTKKEFDGKYGKYYRYKIDEDPNSKVNTILKIAKKRAQIDASLTVSSLSERFTQDLEDVSDNTNVSEPEISLEVISEYEIDVGNSKGKKIKDISIKDLEWYANTYHGKNKKLKEYAALYLKSLKT